MDGGASGARWLVRDQRRCDELLQTRNFIVMKVIVARDIVKYHRGDLKILSGASLSVEAGEKIGLVGRNGAGKTTLLNVLSGNLEPDGGMIERIGGAKVEMTSQSLYLGTKRS